MVEDDAAVAIGDLAVDLHATVDRTGVHDECVRFEAGRTLLGEAEERRVFPEAWEVFLALALMLDAQKIEDIDVFQNIVELVRDGDAHLFKSPRDQRTGADERHARAELEQSVDITAGYS